MIYTAEDMWREARREVGMRKRVYPRWVEQGRMKQEHAEHQIAVMQAIADHFMQQMERERLL